VIAGVCGGLASALRVDATLIRLAFSLLALAGGAGILLYLARWAHSEGRRPIVATGLAVASVLALLVALGMSGTALIGAACILAGAAIAAARGGSLRPGGSLPIPAIALTTAGAVILLGHLGASGSFVAPGAIAGTLVLVLGPWLWQLASERAERIRLSERAAVAARVHDSVLQTLALVQRHADDPHRVASIARRQERELRRWLYGTGIQDAATLEDALADAAAEIEELYRVRIELATAGRAELDSSHEQLVLAAREAMANAAKFSGADEIAVYADSDADGSAVFVRPPGRPRRPPRHRRIDRRADAACRRVGHDHVTAGGRNRGRAETAEARLMRRVVLVDDHELFRAGVRNELADVVEIVGEAGSVAEAVPLIRELDPEVVLLDVHLPDGGGEAVIAAVAPERPGVKFLALSVSDAAEDVIGVIRAGARGYVTKTISRAELTDAIERVAAGDAVFSPRLAGFVLDAFRAGEPVGADAELETLTPREREVLQLIARGYRYKEIAARLHLSVKTIEAHVSSVLRKLQLSSRHELTRWAHERRLI
jgi:DNA-binding NarL/FixJ family response regulator/phage shock protein PspC (stress-responsive transcriptional regulator)